MQKGEEAAIVKVKSGLNEIVASDYRDSNRAEIMPNPYTNAATNDCTTEVCIINAKPNCFELDYKEKKKYHYVEEKLLCCKAELLTISYFA